MGSSSAWIVSPVFLLLVGSVAIRGFRFVADVPKRILMPGVLILCIYGVFAVNNNIFDVGVMFVMGWVGYIMRCATAFRQPRS